MLTASEYLGLCSRSSAYPLIGAGIAHAVWPSPLSDGSLEALATLPGTPTYRLPITSGVGVPAIHIEAARYDPTFPTVLPVRGLPVPMVIGGAVRKYAYP